MGKIAAIAEYDVHKITSSQVIVDLTTSVKELVDNSIDAHAHHIEITFKNYGLELIECSDDGDGISADNFETLALKHYTSKIKSFNDVSSVMTLGFRGEALASLCAIANVCVTTTTKPPRADKLEYNACGSLWSKSTSSRNKGTTVQVSNLFHNLPVRKKEFDKSCKRQFAKCIALLQNYALIQNDIKFAVWHVTPNKKKRLVLNTARCQDMPKKILSIFGSSSMNGLSPIELVLDLNPYKSLMNKRYVEDPTYENTDYKIVVHGYISKSSFGCGRSAKDRQAVFVNRRPIEYPSLLQCCNEIYRTFNNVQYPTVFLNFSLSPRLVDVNVTPDKRTIMLHNERYVIEVFRENLINYYEKQDVVLPKSLLSQPDQPQVKKRRLASQILDIKYREEDSSDEGKNNDNEVSNSYSPGEQEGLKNRARSIEKDTIESAENTESPIRPVSVSEHIPSKGDSSEDLSIPENRNGSNFDTETTLHDFPDVKAEENVSEEPGDTDRSETMKATLERYSNPSQDYLIEKASIPEKSESVVVEIEGDKVDYQARLSKDERLAFICDEPCSHACCPDHMKVKNDDAEEEDEDDAIYASMEPIEVNTRAHGLTASTQTLFRSTYRSLSEQSSVHNLGSERLVLNLKIDAFLRPGYHFKSLMGKRQTTEHRNSVKKNESIQNFEEGEKYLTLTVKKDDFNKMQVVGQFNLGFIIVTRRLHDKYDMFIVDQHASDEKYNFEMLQKMTVFKSQRLIAPLSVELSVIDELLVMDNIDVFEKNGFKLVIEEEGDQGSKIKLLSLPVSKRTLFGIDDFLELVYLIKENGGLQRNDIKCSKIRSMLAMRACRSSIMIGKPLAHSTMIKVVRHLSELEKPWNCPHGRPTMRHLMELKDWDSFFEDYEL